MKYLSGMHAMNVPSSLHMTPDWHTYDYNWSSMDIRESEGSRFGDYGIEKGHRFEMFDGEMNVANQLRAILDLLEDGQVRLLRGMRRDYFETDEYNQEFFDKVTLLRDHPQWEEISHLVEMEFLWDWHDYCEARRVRL